MGKEHAVYKYVKDGKIVYVGKTDSSLKSRVRGHAHEEKFQDYLGADIYYIRLKNPTETTVFEKILINKYRPVLNVVDNYEDTVDIDFVEPDWIKYIDGSNYQKVKEDIEREILDIQQRLSEAESEKKIHSDNDIIHGRDWNLLGRFREMAKAHRRSEEYELGEYYTLPGRTAEEQFEVSNTFVNHGFRFIGPEAYNEWGICQEEYYNENRCDFFLKSLGDWKYEISISDDVLAGRCVGMMNLYGTYLAVAGGAEQQEIRNLEKRISDYKNEIRMLKKQLRELSISCIAS